MVVCSVSPGGHLTSYCFWLKGKCYDLIRMTWWYRTTLSHNPRTKALTTPKQWFPGNRDNNQHHQPHLSHLHLINYYLVIYDASLLFLCLNSFVLITIFHYFYPIHQIKVIVLIIVLKIGICLSQIF